VFDIITLIIYEFQQLVKFALFASSFAKAWMAYISLIGDERQAFSAA